MIDAIYVRKSPSQPDEDGQRQSIVAYLKGSGLEIPDSQWFYDTPLDQDSGGRSGVDELVRLLMDRQVRQVFVSTQGSNGKGYREWLPFIHILRSYGAKLISIQDGDVTKHDPATDQECSAYMEMLSALVNGLPIRPGMGCYRPSVSRYSWNWLAARHGIDPGGDLARKEFQESAELFEQVDRHGDGVLNAADFDWWGDMSRNWGKAMAQRQRPPGMRGGGRWIHPFALRNLLNGDFGSPFNGPGLGELAPDFTLTTQNGKERITLSQYRGQKPVVLIFGSITCGMTRNRFETLEKLYRELVKEVAFLAVYIRETHASDGMRTRYNDQAGIAIPQPREQSERSAVAQQCCSTLGISMPMLVDDMDDEISHVYSAIPNRLYLIDRDGRVAYQSGTGPFGFIPEELEQALLLLLWDQEGTGAGNAS
jgi:hypothetical protein